MMAVDQNGGEEGGGGGGKWGKGTSVLCCYFRFVCHRMKSECNLRYDISILILRRPFVSHTKPMAGYFHSHKHSLPQINHHV